MIDICSKISHYTFNVFSQMLWLVPLPINCLTDSVIYHIVSYIFDQTSWQFSILNDLFSLKRWMFCDRKQWVIYSGFLFCYAFVFMVAQIYCNIKDQNLVHFKQPTLHCLAFPKWSLEGKRHVQVNHIILSSLKKSCYRSGRVFQYQWIVMMTSSNGNIFSVTGLLCGEFTVDQRIPRTKASGAELWCFFDLRLNTQLSKQTWDWWFETPPHHYDVTVMFLFKSDVINICENISMSLSMTNW